MKSLLPFILAAFFINCSEKKMKESPQAGRIPATIPINYDSCKKAVLLNKQKNKTGWSRLSKKEKEKIFTTTVTKTVIPAWIGTAWSFNGTTENPQQGSIACGYFVTTILRDAGLKLARIKLAQCASEEMIISLVQPGYIYRFSNVAMDDFMRFIQQQGYGLYIVGLDNHTGFIYNDGEETCFIHSTFAGTRNVQKEKAASSRVLHSSRYKVLGKVSADERILERWIN